MDLDSNAMIDFIIVLCYFIMILIIAFRGVDNKTLDADVYFLSSRNLKWPSIAASRKPTFKVINFKRGLGISLWSSTANLEITYTRPLIAVFIFVPIFLNTESDGFEYITMKLESRLFIH